MDALKSKLIYLATPYSKYPAGLTMAFVDASRLTGRLMGLGYRAYSPIAHTHPIAMYANIDPYSHAIWLPFDGIMMDKSDVIMVAKMAGWEKSFGIKHEIDVFALAGKPRYSVDPETLEITKET